MRASAAAATLAVLATACGFHLQGAGTLPPAMAKTFVRTRAPHTEFLKQLTDTLRVRGAEVVAAPEDAQALLDQMVRCQVSTFCAPPKVWRMLIQQDLGRWQVPLREALAAGEPLNPEVIEQVRRVR